MFFDILIPLSCGGVGLFLGWVMHALHRSGLVDAPSSSDRPYNTPVHESPIQRLPDDVVVETISSEKVNSVASRIRSFAANLAASIDSHQTRIDAVSSTLNANDLSTTSPVVLEAVEQLLSANELMRTELEESQQRLREQSKELQTATQRAQTDALTGLCNRGAFDEQLSEHHAMGARQAGVLILGDIDHFKAFNDTHGHRCGDAVLRSVASMLESRLEPYGKVARFGGEEFVALIKNDDFDEVLELIEQTRQAIGDREIRFEGKRLRVSMSVGIGRLGETPSGEQQSREQWLQQVDDALYRSKEVGRDCAHYVQGKRFIRVGRPKTAPHNFSDTESLEDLAKESDLSNPTSTLSAGTAQLAVETDQPSTRSIVESLAAVGDESSRVAEPIASPANSSIEQFSAATESEDVEQSIARIASQLANAEPTKAPKGLSYLPDVDAMIDSISDAIARQPMAQRPVHLLALTLSGHPNGATMRSLLQIVRAALRSQDRIGCLNHSTLLVCLADCAEAEVAERAEQICHSAGSVGVQLAAKERGSEGERLSAGIVQLTMDANGGSFFEPDPYSIDDAILQARVTAARAGQQSVKVARLPVLTHTVEVKGLAASFA